MKNRQNNGRSRLTRRGFMGAASGALAGFIIVPRHVLGGAGQIAPSEKVNVASVGAGNQAARNIYECAKLANIVAMSDIDDREGAKRYQEFPQVPHYRDFRVMLEKHEKIIDGVIVACPDHTHAVATMAAIKMGKAVYTQKPLTHTIYEARMLTEAARKAGVITQMGNQGQSGEGTRLIKEWIADGAIGPIREVHCWTDRPHWPQGIPRPKESQTPSPQMDWDLWLGPAPSRPYNECYAPFKWRAWWDFGAGALGDMGCHIMDQPIGALKLGHPDSVEAIYTKTGRDEARIAIEKETAPVGSIVRYEFPACESMPPVTLIWYDGGLKPFRPKELEDDRRWDLDNGILFVGENACLFADCYGSSPRIIPETKMKAYKLPPKTLPRVPNGHHEGDWLRAIKDGKPACSNFDFAGPVTETVLLGNIAIRCAGRKLLWDGQNMKVTNVPEANQYVRTEYREGWSL
jgi:predicted dehydrogenase